MVIGTRHGMLTVITRQHEHHHVQSTPTAGGVASKRGLARWGKRAAIRRVRLQRLRGRRRRSRMLTAAHSSSRRVYGAATRHPIFRDEVCS
jgi:hypothetical protein